MLSIFEEKELSPYNDNSQQTKDIKWLKKKHQQKNSERQEQNKYHSSKLYERQTIWKTWQNELVEPTKHPPNL